MALRAELPPNPVQRFVTARVIVDQHRAIGFEHEEPDGLRKPGREAARVENLASRDQQTHRRTVLTVSDRSERVPASPRKRPYDRQTVSPFRCEHAEFMVRIDLQRRTPRPCSGASNAASCSPCNPRATVLP